MEMSVTKLYDFIKDVDFPATKQELIGYAEEHDLSQSVMDRLEDLPDRTYGSYSDVIKEVVM